MVTKFEVKYKDKLGDYIQNKELTLSTTFILLRILLRGMETWKTLLIILDLLKTMTLGHLSGSFG